MSGPCPEDFDCGGFAVSCPDINGPFRGDVALGRAPGKAAGMVMFFSGGPGTQWWGSSERGELIAAPFLERLRNVDALDVVLVKWNINWGKNRRDKQPGPARNACRPASVIRYVHDHYYRPPATAQGRGKCGFCISGNSAGGIQSAYPLSHYGLKEIVDAAVLTSGPPHAAMDRGCLRRPGEDEFWYDEDWARLVDTNFGYGRGGPCQSHDPTWTPRWIEESVAGPGDYTYMDTRVAVIVGDADTTPAPVHAATYVDALRRAGSRLVSIETIENMSHSVQQSEAGLAALEAQLTGIRRTTPSPSMASASSSPVTSVAARCPGSDACEAQLEAWMAEAILAGGAVVGLAYPAFVFSRRRQRA